jgi:NAD(P)-dependent dehydrogenase (short-subunit alcohol dehydrogenase family)
VVVGAGAEAGLGAALCRRFGREGLHVFVAGRTAERLARVVESIATAGGRATAVPTDTTVEADVVRLFDRAATAGPLEVAVCNAGTNQCQLPVQSPMTSAEKSWPVASAPRGENSMAPRRQLPGVFRGSMSV